MKLNLGCGRDYRIGWTNVDHDAAVEPDLVLDLERAPWPFSDASADEIVLKFVLEHLGASAAAFGSVMRELYRVAKPDAVIEIHSRYPLHRDFLDDPSCVRRITPEALQYFDLSVGEVWQATKQQQRSLAPSLGVDFETIEALYFPDPELVARRQENDRALAELARTNINIIRSTATKLKARKPFAPGRSLQSFGAICLDRHGGMGDVVMALAAAKALKEATAKPIYLLTSPALRALAETSPALDGVLTDRHALTALEERYRDSGGVRYADLNGAAFGISRLHQVDAYLESFGLTAPANAKEVVLADPAAVQHAAYAAALPPPASGRQRVLIHPAMGDPNRTWRPAKWHDLCRRLCDDGHQVILIGKSVQLEQRGVHAIDIPGAVNAMDRLDLLETVALMRVSDVLVSTDSGPVQLAGATPIHIVGLYSVVSGRQRLPFRHGVAGWRTTAIAPACSFSPCYQWMLDPVVLNQSKPDNMSRLFSEWCPNPTKFQCMGDGIAVDEVYAAVRVALADMQSAPPPEPRRETKGSAAAEIGAP